MVFGGNIKNMNREMVSSKALEKAWTKLNLDSTTKGNPMKVASGGVFIDIEWQHISFYSSKNY